MPASCFCEQIRPALVRQPVDAASSLAFWVVALMVWRTARKRAVRPMLPALYAVSLLVVGAGSAAFHATLTFWGQTLDVLGMYLVATFLLLHAAARVWAMTGRVMGTAYAGSNLVLLALLVTLPGVRRYLFAALVIAILGFETLGRRGRPPAPAAGSLWMAAGLLVIGFVFWTLDITHALCAPTSLLQGHALWHLCGAGAAWEVHRHLMAEDGASGA